MVEVGALFKSFSPGLRFSPTTECQRQSQPQCLTGCDGEKQEKKRLQAPAAENLGRMLTEEVRVI